MAQEMKRSDWPMRILCASCALLIGVMFTAAHFQLLERGNQTPDPTLAPDAQPAPDTQPAPTDPGTPVAADPAATRVLLASWNPSSEAYKRLTAFVEEVCDPTSPYYLEPEERVATFDMDGTFLSEKAPIYIDQTFAAWHVLYDPAYDAPAELRAAVSSVLTQIEAGIVPDAVDLNAVLAESYVGRTPDELMADILRFAETTPVTGFSGMTYAQSFYRPMLEVIAYLRANNFDVYVVSACERYVARVLAVTYAGFDPTHVIGTDLLVKADDQGDAAGIDYTFELDDAIVIAGPKIQETGKTNKVIAITNEIGRRPVLAFGNSSGDFAMLNFATSNPDHPGLGFLVIADDEVREYGDGEKAAKMRAEVAAQGWVGISMRDDWTTIYGDGVAKTTLPEAA